MTPETPTIPKHHPCQIQPKKGGSHALIWISVGTKTSPVVTNPQLGQDSITSPAQNKTTERGTNPCPNLNPMPKIQPLLHHNSGVLTPPPLPIFSYKTFSQDSIEKLSLLTMTSYEVANIRFLCNSTLQEDLEEEVGNIIYFITPPQKHINYP